MVVRLFFFCVRLSKHCMIRLLEPPPPLGIAGVASLWHRDFGGGGLKTLRIYGSANLLNIFTWSSFLSSAGNQQTTATFRLAHCVFAVCVFV